MVFKVEGFGFEGGEIGNAIGDDGWVNGLAGVVSGPIIAIEGDPFDFDGDPKEDFDNCELGPLDKVSVEDKFDASLVGLWALAFFFVPIRIGGEEGVVASVSTEEATAWLAGGRE